MDTQRNEVKFNFYGIGVIVSCTNKVLCDYLKRDFSYFKALELKDCSKIIVVNAYISSSFPEPFPLLISRFRNRNVEIFEQKNIRVCDYQGEGRTIVDLSRDHAKLYAKDLDRLHERTYLFILSRVGKALDLVGLHRLHAMAVVRNGKLYVGMMPMNGGKTTLLSYFLNEKSYSLLSDDSPLVDRQGRVYPFPIRIGFESNGKRPELFKSAPAYHLNRKEYGKKDLYCLDDLSIKVGGHYRDIILFRGYKGFSKARLVNISRLSLFPFIFEQGVIGIGLPILIEYFWEFGLWDFVKKTKIFCSRLLGLTRFLLKAKVYRFEMGDDGEENVDYLKKYKAIN